MDETNLTYLAYGFAAAWVIICLYVASLVIRERKVRNQIESLRRMVEEREPK